VTADTSDVGKYEEEDVDRPSQTEELAGYLWDNYIEYDAHLKGFIMNLD
jgi:histone deacetylase 6